MNTIKQHLLLLLALVFVTSSCVNTKTTTLKTEDCINSVEGTLIDMTGLDGCGWMIKLKDDKKVNPINLKHFNITLTANKKITFSYTKNNDLVGICMAGQIVDITCIQDQSKE
ncbi:hypothetical protein [Olleya namhaensis]|uniref:hypothetical protein n=1 Tax=Olleya namhaensis TaxID=1144750 RepID=UPI00232FB172|nr:hypothetical protein [Olleya namhaensis]